MANKKNNNKTGALGGYIIMGAGFAIGAAIVSVVVTGASMLAAEGIKMIKASRPAGGALPANNTGQYAMPNGATQQQAPPQNGFMGR
jgi:hypothetical protein